MAYEAHKWKIGEEITSEKLNHIEKGIEEAGGDIQTNIQNPTDGQTLKYDAESGKWVNAEGGSGTLVVNIQSENNILTLDKTWQQIYDAYPYVVAREENGSEFVINSIGEINYYNGAYRVSINVNTYTTNVPDGYPDTSGM